LRAGFFAEGGKEFDAIVRFSNAFSVNQKDTELDQRGLAIRVMPDGNPASGNVQDFLMTNTPVSFGRDAQQFVKTSKLLVDNAKPVAFFKVLFQPERLRILKQLFSGLKTSSMAAERYWSRTPFQIGDYAMKFMVQPAKTNNSGGASRRWKSLKEPAAKWGEQDYLRQEFEDLLNQLQQEGRNLKFDFRIQLYQNEEKTPMENASREWKESDAPFATVAELEIPHPDLNDEERSKLDDDIEKMAFSPWNTKAFKPLGSMNEARKLVYDKSAEKRGGRTLRIGR
jgi:catalase